MRELCLSTKFPHKEIRWNYGILRSENQRNSYSGIFVVRCAIQYHMHNLKNVKNTHGGVLLLVKLQAKACNSTKSNTPSWVFFTFFKLCEWHQIAQSTTFFIYFFPFSVTGYKLFWNYLRRFECKLLYSNAFQWRNSICNNITMFWYRIITISRSY